MASTPEQGEFSLIIENVDSARLEESSGKFAEAFHLDGNIAKQIVKSAPIVFVGGLSKKEVKAITPSLTELSNQGIVFRVTTRPTKKVPKVNWPIRPQFTAAGVTGATGLAFEWNNNAFVCPGCGETFLFRRMGKFELGDDSSDAPVSAPAVAAPAPEAPAPAEPEFQEAPVMEDLPEMAEAPQMEAPQMEEPPAAEPALEAEPVQEVGLDQPDESLELQGEPEEVNLDENLDLQGVEEIPADEGPDLGSVEELPGDAPETAPQLDVSEEIQEDDADEGGDRYNVFLSKITDKKKQANAAELIAEVKGCPVPEAKQLASRLVIPLAKNVGKSKAEEILGKFKKLRIFGRMTKAK